MPKAGVSSQQLPCYPSVHVGQPEIAAGVTVGEALVIEAQEPEDSGVQIVNVDRMLDGTEAEIVGGAMNLAALDAAAGQPHAEAIVVVVAAIDAAGVGARSRQLHRRSSAKLATPDHQRIVQHAALLQVFQETADGLIAFPGQAAMLGFQIVVAVPGLTGAVPDLDEADAFFQEPAGNEKLPALNAGAVQSADVPRLAVDVERIFGIALHAISQLEGLNAGFELSIVLPLPLMALVQLGQQV